MEPLLLEVIAEHRSTLRAETSLAELPNAFKLAFTNPVQFYLANVKTKESYLVNNLDNPKSDKARKLPVIVDLKGNLYFYGETESEPFWMDANCTSHLSIEETGVLYKYDAPVKHELLNVNLIGKIELKAILSIHIQEKVTGGCEQTFATIQKCFEDIEPYKNCEGSSDDENQALYVSTHAFFDPFVKTKVLKVEEFYFLKTLTYEASYK
ncbi:MAG: hypothetical protein HY072_10215 [Deltaproteobacteria bacterium]|nr:hypothetical protein [Deltaproteobacteria bacterium]